MSRGRHHAGGYPEFAFVRQVCDFMAADRVLKDDKVKPAVLLPLLSPFHRSLPLIASCGFPLIDHVRLKVCTSVEESLQVAALTKPTVGKPRKRRREFMGLAE